MVEPHQTNVVLVGKKDIMNYVLAAIRLFNDGAEEVIIRARGMNICKAVDVAENIKNLFMKNTEVAGVEIYSEELEDPKGKKKRVSAIEIKLVKKQ
ncbi:MAG: DNA-binding protein Alba [Desulfurococcales archaeon]|nr:DNA-binding protein Alba [Desulfurococcales archaeon]MCE4622961.1 DNA-binding protein Alba [Desulfurococcales archaeon]MCE4626465.1 DNA-binding protein Alba [Desulfurococcales archaeon]MCE4629262.1 DNA-binding protein Alba [Desulfurococcales archaeon]